MHRNIFRLAIPFGTLAVLILLMGNPDRLSAQSKEDGPPDNEEEFKARYQERIKESHLFGVYIPNDLEDAFRELDRLTPEASRSSFQKAPEDVVVRKLFFSLGRWMDHNWGLTEGSRLAEWFRQKGVFVPDDMIRVLIASWHRQLNGRPVELEAQVQAIQERIEKEREARRAKAPVISEERRKRE